MAIGSSGQGRGPGGRITPIHPAGLDAHTRDQEALRGMGGSGNGRGPGGRFAPGCSGNPRGRPPGSRNRVTRWALELLQADAPTLVDAVLYWAQWGNETAMKLCFGALIPPLREPPIDIQLPKIETAADIGRALCEVERAVAEGRATAAQGEAIARVLTKHLEVLQSEDLERRLSELEEKHKAGF